MKKAYSLIEKIIYNHFVSNYKNNYEIEIKVDQVYMEEHSAGNVFKNIDEVGITELSCEIAACYCGHNSLTKEHEMEVHQLLKEKCMQYKIYYEKPAVGICHQLHLECFAKPGVVILGANSHTSYCGGIGALSIGTGGTDIVEVLAGLNYQLPAVKVIGICIKGRLNDWCTAQDVGFEILKRIRLGGAQGKFIEFFGEGIKNMDIEERCVICQMCTEVNAITAIFPSDETTYKYLHDLNRGNEWQKIERDEHAEYVQCYEIDLNEIVPLIALPSQPDNVINVEDSLNIPLHQIIIGGCTSGTFKDISMAADILSKLHINDNVSVIIQPASNRILRRLEENGIIEKLLVAGAEISFPSCDACVGIVYVPSSGFNSLRVMSRNFIGRCGCENANVFLAGTLTAAVSAANGVVTNPLDYYNGKINMNKINTKEVIKNHVLKSFNLCSSKYADKVKDIEGEIVANVLQKFDRPISTDEIIPNGTDIKAKRDDIEKISKYLFYRIDSSICKKIKMGKNYCIIAKENFGEGSARENAAIILRYVGVRFIIAESYYHIFRKNMINYGVIPLYFSNKNDWNNISDNDELLIYSLEINIRNNEFIVSNKKKKESYKCYSDLTEKEKEIILSGSLVDYIKKMRMRY